MDRQERLQHLIYRADTLLDVVRRLDHGVVRACEPDAAIRLQAALEELEQAWAMMSPAGESELDRELRRQKRDVLSEAGFGDRLDRVYDSRDRNQLLSWRDVPHRKGIPQYDWVVAPDYSPVEGLHILVVVKDAVLSFVLPAESEQQPWKLRAQRRFENTEQMLRRIDSLSVGMPVSS